MSSEQLESSPDENAAVPIYKMSYEQLRAANIERNNAKLRELFGTDKLSFMSSVSVAPGRRASGSTKSNAQSEELTDVSNSAGQPLGIAEQAAEFEKLVAVFPGRKVELARIWGYLDPAFCPAPALLVQGPSGSGKSDISRSALVSRRVAHVCISCDVFSTQKQMMRLLWREIVSVHCLAQGNAVNKARKEKMFDESTITAKAPNNFTDLVVNLRTLLQSLCHLESCTTVSPTSISDAKLCLLFDNIDKADHLEKGLTFRLLTLGELCHSSIKVVATLAVLQRKPYPCILVSFQSYSNAQIKEIMMQKLTSNGAISPNFGPVLNDVLHRLTTTTNHIGELLEVISIINEMNKLPGGSGAASATATGRVLTASAATEFVLEQVQMPTFHMKGISGSGMNNAALSGNKRQRGDANSSVKFSRLLALEKVVDVETLRGATSCVELPLSVKYLIIAVFLASNNAKENDDYIFAMKQKGRRKKEKVGTDSSTTDASASRSFTLDRLLSIFAQIVCLGGISSLGGGERAALALGRTAGLPEPSWVADQIEAYYGDARLFTAINDLEAQHYLVRGPGWSLEKPVYVSAVPLKLASDIARGLSFDLDAFRSS